MSLVTSVVLQGLAVVRVTWGKLLGLSGPVSCQHLRPWVGGRIIPGNHVPNLQQCQPFLPRSLPAGNGTALVPLRKVGIGEAESPEGRSWAPNPGLWTQPWAASRALNETRTQWVLVSWAGGPAGSCRPSLQTLQSQARAPWGKPGARLRPCLGETLIVLSPGSQAA